MPCDPDQNEEKSIINSFKSTKQELNAAVKNHGTAISLGMVATAATSCLVYNYPTAALFVPTGLAFGAFAGFVGGQILSGAIESTYRLLNPVEAHQASGETREEIYGSDIGASCMSTEIISLDNAENLSRKIRKVTLIGMSAIGAAAGLADSYSLKTTGTQPFHLDEGARFLFEHQNRHAFQENKLDEITWQQAVKPRLPQPAG